MKPRTRASVPKIRQLWAISSAVQTKRNCASGQANRRALNIKARHTCSTCWNQRRAKGRIIIVSLFSKSGKRQLFQGFSEHELHNSQGAGSQWPAFTHSRHSK